MRALISRLGSFGGLVELFMLAAILVSWGGSSDGFRFDGSGGAGFTGGGFTGRPILEVSITADKTEMPTNLAANSVDPALPYTNTIVVQIKQDGRLFPAASVAIDLIEVAQGSLLYLDGDSEHQDDDGSPLAFRRLTFEDTSGIVTAHFTTGTQPGTATIVASTTDPNTGQVVSATLQINVIQEEDRPTTSITFAGPYVNAVLAGQSGFGSPALLDGTYSRVVSVVVNDGNGRPVNPNTRINFFLFDAPITDFPANPGSFFIAGNNGDPVEGMRHFSAQDGDFLSKGVRVFYRLLLDGRLQPNNPLPDNRYQTGVWRVENVLTQDSLTVQTGEIPFHSVPDLGEEVPYVPDNGATVPYIIGYAWYGTVLSPSYTNTTGVADTLLTYPVERVGQTAVLVACIDGQEICDILNTCDVNGQNCSSVYLGVTDGTDRVLTTSATSLGPNRSTDVRMCLRDANFVPLRATEIRYDIGSTGAAKVTVNDIEANKGSFLTGADGCATVMVASSGQVPGSTPIVLNFSADYVLDPVAITIRAPGSGTLDGMFNSCEFNPEEGTGVCNLTLRMTDDEGTPMSGVLIALGEFSAAGPFTITFDPAEGVFGKTDEVGQLKVKMDMESPGAYEFPFLTASGGGAEFVFELTVPGPGTLNVSLVGGTTAKVNEPYSAVFQAEGGITPYVWTVTAGALPPSIVLSEDGTLSGTPTPDEKGVYSFAVKVKDSKNSTGYGAFTITVDEATPLELEFTGSTNAVLHEPYSAVITAKNGVAPYSFSILAGSLPPGLALSGNGTLSGTPTVAGSFAFSVLATDTKEVTGTGNFTITVDSVAPLEISFSGPDSGMVGVSYSAVLTATGGTAPYSWRVIAGAPPTGVSLSSSGTLSGIPTKAGIFTFSVEATDANGVEGNSTVQITISSEEAPIIQTESPLPNAVPGEFYAVVFTATGGVLPYEWNLEVGTWPASLSLDSDTGSLSGTPQISELGTYSFVVRATDVNGAYALKTFELTVGSATPLEVSLIGSTDGAVSSTYNAVLTATGGTAPYIWAITAGTLPTGVSLNSNTGTLSGVLSTTGVFTFSAQATDGNATKGTNTFTITVNSAAPLTVELAGPTTGNVSVFYSAVLTATGGTAPYTWTLTGGSVPPGVSLNTSTGALTGIPTTEGIFTFSVQVVDSRGLTGSSAITITVDAEDAPTIETDSPLPGATPGQFYAVIFSASSGVPPYQWIIEQGTSPASLTLSSNGTLSGTPTVAEVGDYTFVVRVTDSVGAVARKTFDLTVGSGGSSASKIILLADPPQLESSGQLPVNITAVLRDDNGVLIEGATAEFSANNDGTLQVIRATTDETGTALAILSTQGNNTNRIITVTATSGGAQATIDIPVAGTTITSDSASSVVIGNTVAITFTLKDSSGNGIAGETLVVTSDPTENAINPPNPVTNSAGQATVEVTASVADVDGNISITASALGAVNVKVLQLVTDVFEFVEPDPSELPPDVCLSSANCTSPKVTPPQILTVRLTSSGVGVAGETVTFETTRGTLSASTDITDGAGEATVTITSDNAGPAVITASTTTSAGEPVEVQVQVNFVATTPTQMVLQAEPGTISFNLPGSDEERSTITATVRDANFNLVKGVTVSFVLTDVTGGSINPASAVTDEFGQASTVYTAGTAPSALNGVEINATVTGFPAVTKLVTLTVSQRSLFITLGTGNEIVEPRPEIYEYPFSVLVNDSAGLPVQNALVTLNIIPMTYGKGFYFLNIDDEWVQSIQATCSNEDLNQNGILDPGEDFNGNGRLDPGNPATVDLPELTTDASGFAFFNVVYAQEYGNWVAVELTARATVAGSEAIESTTFVLPVLADDLTDADVDPPGNPSPFGEAANCADPN